MLIGKCIIGKGGKPAVLTGFYGEQQDTKEVNIEISNGTRINAILGRNAQIKSASTKIMKKIEHATSIAPSPTKGIRLLVNGKKRNATKDGIYLLLLEDCSQFKSIEIPFETKVCFQDEETVFLFMKKGNVVYVNGFSVQYTGSENFKVMYPLKK